MFRSWIVGDNNCEIVFKQQIEKIMYEMIFSKNFNAFESSWCQISARNLHTTATNSAFIVLSLR